MAQKQANANHSLMNGQHARVARQTDYPSKDALAERIDKLVPDEPQP